MAVWWVCDKEYRHQCRITLADLKQGVIVGKRHISRSVLARTTPWCPACYKCMHLVSANTDKEYPKLSHVMFVCDCGRTSDQLVQV